MTLPKAPLPKTQCRLKSLIETAVGSITATVGFRLRVFSLEEGNWFYI